VIQELARKVELEQLRTAGAKAGLVYCHAFVHGVGFPLWANCDGTGRPTAGLPLTLAPGLMVISRYPIVESSYKKFSLNGKPYAINHLGAEPLLDVAHSHTAADYLGAKGIGLCRVRNLRPPPLSRPAAADARGAGGRVLQPPARRLHRHEKVWPPLPPHRLLSQCQDARRLRRIRRHSLLAGQTRARFTHPLLALGV
jgi:hypothetical protein